MWCSHCVEVIKVREECGGKFVSCSLCGKVLDCAEFKRLRMFGKLKKSQGLCGSARNLFDIDDHEVAQYLHNGKERCLEKIIWEEMHNLYLQLKASKEAKGTGQASLDNGFEELISAKELAKWTAAALGKSRKEKKHKRLTDIKSSTSTKSRYHELKRKDNTKKQRTASEAGECESDGLKAIEETRKESEAAAVNNAEDLISADADHYEDANGDRCNNEDSDCYGNGERL